MYKFNNTAFTIQNDEIYKNINFILEQVDLTGDSQNFNDLLNHYTLTTVSKYINIYIKPSSISIQVLYNPPYVTNHIFNIDPLKRDKWGSLSFYIKPFASYWLFLTSVPSQSYAKSSST